MSVYKIQFDQKTNNRVKISKNIKPSIMYTQDNIGSKVVVGLDVKNVSSFNSELGTNIIEKPVTHSQPPEAYHGHFVETLPLTNSCVLSNFYVPYLMISSYDFGSILSSTDTFYQKKNYSTRGDGVYYA
jgi:hypothetical protein